MEWCDLHKRAAETDAACAVYRVVIERGLRAPSGEAICSCGNRNAVRAGMKRACWYCDLRDALASDAGAKAQRVLEAAKAVSEKFETELGFFVLKRTEDYSSLLVVVHDLVKAVAATEG